MPPSEARIGKGVIETFMGEKILIVRGISPKVGKHLSRRIFWYHNGKLVIPELGESRTDKKMTESGIIFDRFRLISFKNITTWVHMSELWSEIGKIDTDLPNLSKVRYYLSKGKIKLIEDYKST